MTSPHTFRVGDRVTNCEGVDGDNAGLVVGVYPISGRDVSLVIWRPAADIGRYNAGESDQITLLEPAVWRNRSDWLDWLTLDAMLDVQPDDPRNRYAVATVPLMREAIRRALLAKEFAHRAADMIRAPVEDMTRIGWRWTHDQQVAARALALCERAEEQISDLLDTCLTSLTSEANEAAMQGEVTP